MGKPVTNQQIENIEMCDEYSLRHHWDDITDLAESYRHLVYLLDEAGVLQLDDEWAKKIQAHVSGVAGVEF